MMMYEQARANHTNNLLEFGQSNVATSSVMSIEAVSPTTATLPRSPKCLTAESEKLNVAKGVSESYHTLFTTYCSVALDAGGSIARISKNGTFQEYHGVLQRISFEECHGILQRISYQYIARISCLTNENVTVFYKE